MFNLNRMFIRLFLLFLCALFAGSLHAAPHHNGGGPQDLTYQNEDSDETGDAELTAPPPVLRAAPSVITTGPMGSSPLTPPPLISAPVMTPTIIAAPSKEDAVERGELAAPVLTAYGVLDERSGALPMDAWRTLTYHDALAVLTNTTQRVNSGNGNLILNDVLRVAALSRTYEPTGPADLAASYFNARIMAAQAAGDSDGALALFRTRPDTFKVADWQAFIEQEVRQRRFAEVCAISADKLVQDLSPFAQKMSILCDIKNGKAEPARLHLDLLREANDGDTLFLELAERALNPNFVSKSKQVLKLENVSTLHVAALTLGKPKLKPEQIDKLMNPAQPILLDVPLLGNNAADAQRLKYAEGFARSGQLTAKDYQSILASIKFPPKAIAQFRTNPESLLTVPEKEWPAPLRRAAALRAIAEEDNNTQKAHIIAAAMAGLTNADVLGPLGDALMANVSGMSPLPDNVAAASAMARLLLLRNTQDAGSWWRLASASPANREALLPIFPLALLRGVIKEDDRNTWFENYSRTQAMSAEKKNLNLAMVKILGVMLPSDEDSQLAAQNVFPAMHPIDKRLDVLIGNLGTGNSNGVLRALIALRGMHQDALAEKLALLNL
ncbi:MAG: hypothetical protein K2Q32_03160 [Alphaproteobacteria bacterium]|nr:hypothetical protein [Alphaproteobacteria bacterium]